MRGRRADAMKSMPAGPPAGAGPRYLGWRQRSIFAAMQTHITPDEIQAATRQLAKSENGRAALLWLSDGMDAAATDLDLLDQRAFLALLGGVWHGQAGVVKARVRETLAANDA